MSLEFDQPSNSSPQIEPVPTIPNPNSVNAPQKSRLPLWRLWIPLGLQSLLILSVPAQAIYTHLTGKIVILQTAPVDPYDFLRGYYQTLSYDISRWDTLEKLPGWNELLADPAAENSSYPTPGTRFYVILEQSQPQRRKSQQPQAWKPVKISRDRPENLKPNQVALRGRATHLQVEYGLENYYMPEDQRTQVNDDISRAQIDLDQPFVVEVKIDSTGRAVPISLWVDGQNYQF